MITEDKLIELGFLKQNVNNTIYYINGDFVLEKIYRGYLCNKPYRVIYTINNLKKILK